MSQQAPPPQQRPQYPQAYQTPTYQQERPAPPQPHSYQQPAYQQPPEPPAEALNLHNFVGMMGRWRGGQATRTEKSPCPDCGSDLYFSRANNVSRMGGSPAPHCFSCGYSGGLIPTQGDAGVWGAA